MARPKPVVAWAYLGGDPAAVALYEANDGPEDFWIMPAPAHAEALVGVGNQPAGGVRAVALNEQIALKAGRMQYRLLDAGDRMATRDLLVAATARLTGGELIVADEDFETGLLSEMVDVTNLRRGE